MKKFIGAYASAMGGVDAIVFTAGIGIHHGGERGAVAQMAANHLAVLRIAQHVNRPGGDIAVAAAMGGVDAIVFTAGIGENSCDLRQKICEGLSYMGVEMDAEKNNVRGKEVDVSAAGSYFRKKN